MWDLIPRTTRLTIIVLLVAYFGWFISWADQLITGNAMTPLKSASMVTSAIGVVVVGAFGLLWRRLWRWIPLLDRWYPDLTGRWEGTYLSTYVRPETGQPATGAIWVVIRQGLFNTSIVSGSDEMRSHSTRSWLDADRDAQRFRLGYTYSSEPDAAVRQRSAPHEGICWLTSMPDLGPDKLKGLYYTQRSTIGDLSLQRVSRDCGMPVNVAPAP
jgi:hypothetical protein